MQRTHRARPRFWLAFPLLLAITLVSGALALRAEKAEAGAKSSFYYLSAPNADTVILTSDRLDDVTVRATEIITLRSNGTVSYHGDNFHNSGLTRKYFTGRMNFYSPTVGFGDSAGINCHRLNPDEHWSGGDTTHTLPLLQQNWWTVLGDIYTQKLSVKFELDATRISC